MDKPNSLTTLTSNGIKSPAQQTFFCISGTRDAYPDSHIKLIFHLVTYRQAVDELIYWQSGSLMIVNSTVF